MQLIDFIVCDDIRREISAKHTLVGVYNDININLPSKPKKDEKVVLKLGFFIRILLEKKEKVLPDNFEFELFYNKNKVANITGPMKIPEGKEQFNIAIVVDAFPFSESGFIASKVRFKKSGELISTIEPRDIKATVSFPE